MEYFIFLFGLGFGLFVALLAWGNQLRTPRMEILELENEFVTSTKLSKKYFHSLIRDKKITKFEPDHTFDDKMLSIFEMIEKGIIDKNRIETIQKFQEIYKTRYLLEKSFNYKYFSSLILAYFLIIASVILITSEDLITYIFGVVFIWSCVILTILIIIYFLENKYIDYLTNIKDTIGDE